MSKKPTRTPDGTERVGSMRAAAAKLERPIQWIVRAKDAGVDAFKANGSVILAPVKEWIEANLEMLESTKGELPLKDQKLVEEVRRIRTYNDREDGKLIERAWVRERFHRYGGELAAIRAKAEAEDPVRFAETGSDIALIRSEYRKTWDAIMIAVQNAAHHFAE